MTINPEELRKTISLYNEFGMMADEDGFSMSEILYQAAKLYENIAPALEKIKKASDDYTKSKIRAHRYSEIIEEAADEIGEILNGK